MALVVHLSLAFTSARRTLRIASASLVLPTLFCVSAAAQNSMISQTDRTISYPVSSVAQGDINSDGYPDFVFGLAASLDMPALFSDGHGAYVNFTVPTSYCPSAPLGFGDFLRNGHTDLLVSLAQNGSTPCGGSAPAGSYSELVNNGAGSFYQTRFFAGQTPGLVVADFNHDQKLDLVAYTGNEIALEYGDGYGNFSSPYRIVTLTGDPYSLTNGKVNLVAGDFDGNGCTDAAWTETEPYGQRGFQSQLRVAYGDCHGGFTVTTAYNFIGEIDNLVTAELNRDGVSDIVSTLDAAGEGVTNPTLQLSYGQRNRTFTTKLIADSSLSGPLQAVDLNGDGYTDVAYVSSSASGTSIRVRAGDASQTFTAISDHPLSGANNAPSALLTGDYNRDGKMDLAVLAAQGGATGESVLSFLTNTSTYAGGVCVPPVTPGIRNCSPGFTSGTTLKVLAAATNTNPTVYM